MTIETAGVGPQPQFFDTDGGPARKIGIPEPNEWYLAFGDNPWAIWYQRDPESDNMVFAARIHLRSDADPITVTGVAVLSLDGQQPITTSNLRDLPLTKLSRILNQRRLAEHIRHLHGLPAGSTGWDFSPAQFDFPLDLVDFVLAAKLTVDLTIVGADKSRRPDDFYVNVADAWTSAVLIGATSAAQALADANHVPVSTVYRWVREARRRGLMAASPRQAQHDDSPK